MPIQVKNDAFAEETNVTEKILSEVHRIYMMIEPGSVPTNGLQDLSVKPALLKPAKEGILAICSKLGLNCIPPRRKINVMIVGNHSAGKSSYINWYIGEKIQKAGVAIETQGFTFVTSGKQRTTLKGEATLQLFNQFVSDLEPFKPAIYNGIQTEISTSKSKCFGLITFIDTPGLVDGNFQYPFPVEDVIASIARHTDLIYIFFDPIGQALCERTMKTIKMLNREHAEKLRYFLSKADTVPNEADRQKVLVQITQNLSWHIRSAHAFELPTIYLTDHSPGDCTISNALEHSCEEMVKTISLSVQNTLNNFERDCRRIASTVDDLLAADEKACNDNRNAFSYGGRALLLLSVHIPVISMAIFLAHLKMMTQMPGEHLFTWLAGVMLAGNDVQAAGWRSIARYWVFTILLTAALLVISRSLRNYKPHKQTYTKKEIANLEQTKEYVLAELLPKQASLYKLYFDHAVSDVQ